MIIDSNLLVLLLVGLLDQRRIPSFRRTKAYTDLDFRVLYQFVGQFERRIVTPHMLTEVSNLAGRSLGNRSYDFFQQLAAWLDNPSGRSYLEERYRPAALVSRDPEFRRLGLTDAMVLDLATHRHALVLTDDAPLGQALSERGIDVLSLADLVDTASP